MSDKGIEVLADIDAVEAVADEFATLPERGAALWGIAWERERREKETCEWVAQREDDEHSFVTECGRGAYSEEVVNTDMHPAYCHLCGKRVVLKEAECTP